MLRSSPSTGKPQSFKLGPISPMQEPAITNCPSQVSAYTHFLVSLLISASQPFVAASTQLASSDSLFRLPLLSRTRFRPGRVQSEKSPCLPVTARSLTTFNQSLRRLRHFQIAPLTVFISGRRSTNHTLYIVKIKQ